jgi:hypothetical protein
MGFSVSGNLVVYVAAIASAPDKNAKAKEKITKETINSFLVIPRLLLTPLSKKLIVPMRRSPWY